MLIPAVPSTGGAKPPASSCGKAVYTPKGFFPHAGWLGQPCGHCPRFPTAASRRSRARVSVPVWPTTLSGRLPVIGLVGRYPTNYLIGRTPLLRRPKAFIHQGCPQWTHRVLAPLSEGYPRPQGRLRTCYAPVRRSVPAPKGRPIARLACVRPPASVHPEPGSNSPWYETFRERSGATPRGAAPQPRPACQRTFSPQRAGLINKPTRPFGSHTHCPACRRELVFHISNKEPFPEPLCHQGQLL